MQFHCFSDLQIATEIVFLGSSPPPREGKRSQRKAARVEGEAPSAARPLAAAGSWRDSGCCALKRCEKRQRGPRRGGRFGARPSRPVSSPRWGRGAEAPRGSLARRGRQRVRLRLWGEKRLKSEPACSCEPRGGGRFIAREWSGALRSVRLGNARSAGWLFAWRILLLESPPFTLPIGLPDFGLVHCN